MPTDKIILMKGLKYMGWALPMFLMGPVVLFNAFQNEGYFWFVPLLIVALTMCILAIVFMFKGLKTILKSMTD